MSIRLFFALNIGFAAACTSAPTAGQAAIADIAVCIPTRSAGTAPLTDPGGPFFHQVQVARTSDGLTLTSARQALVHASVPDGVRRADGSVFVYYVNGNGGAIWVARVVGSDSLSEIGPITINGIASPVGAVDPDATLLDNGKIRLAYFGGFSAPGNSPRAMCIADSDDGISFSVRANALPFTGAESMTDPSLVRLSDGSWLMAISAGQQTIIARSADGLAFTRESTLSFGGVPELALAGGALRLYVCSAGIVAYRSTDAGRTWTREGTVVQPGSGATIVCDPSYVAGAGLFIYKTG